MQKHEVASGGLAFCSFLRQDLRAPPCSLTLRKDGLQKSFYSAPKPPNPKPQCKHGRNET